MREVVIQIPTCDAEQNIEIDVSINGRKRRMKYRVEIIEWDAYPDEGQDRVSILRRVIREHDNNWDLVQIGAPSDNDIPIMFRHKPEGLSERMESRPTSKC